MSTPTEAPPQAVVNNASRVVGISRRHVVIIGVASLLWLWGVLQVDESALGSFGLVTVLPWSVFAALILMIFGFATVVKVDLTGHLQGAYVIGITLMLHGIPTLAYEHLRFSWAWKHVGIVDYILRFGDVDPMIASLPAYHNWPGFFGLNAWITEVSELESALSYAAWAPILFNLLFLGALYVMYKAFTNDRRLVWTSLLIFTLGNWVGQDYFAPQALAFFLYLLVLAILLRWFAREPKRTEDLVSSDRDDDRIEPHTIESFALSAVVLVSLIAISVSHQLTPVITLAALAALVVFRVIRVTWPLIVMAILLAIWFFGPARAFMIENLETLWRDIGGFQANIDRNLIDYAIVNQAQRTVSLIARLLSASIFALGALGWLRRRFHNLPTGRAVLLAAVPGFLVVASSYGGEVIFRAYLFALPFVAFLAASLWFPQPGSGTRAWTRYSLAVVAVVLVGGLLIADFGADRRQVFTDDELNAANYIFETAEPGALIIEGTRDYPRQHRNYETFTFLALDRSTPDTLDGLLADPAVVLASWLEDDERYNGGFVIITQSQRYSASDLGTLLSPTLDFIETALLASDLFEVAYESGTARVFAPVEKR